VAKLCPELDKVKILKGFDENDKPILVEKKNKITLRMLLSHTGMVFLLIIFSWV